MSEEQAKYVSISGADNMSNETLGALAQAAEIAYQTFGKPSPISPEKREEIQRDAAYVDWWDMKSGEKDFTSAEIKEYVAAGNRLKKSIHLLLASEQAWKEEAERLSMELRVKTEYAEQLEKDNYHAEANLSHIDGLLNQAIEVLTWYSDESNHEAVTHPVGKGFETNSEVSLDKGNLAREFLSSLSQEGNACQHDYANIEPNEVVQSPYQMCTKCRDINWEAPQEGDKP